MGRSKMERHRDVERQLGMAALNLSVPEEDRDNIINFVNSARLKQYERALESGDVEMLRALASKRSPISVTKEDFVNRLVRLRDSELRQQLSAEYDEVWDEYMDLSKEATQMVGIADLTEGELWKKARRIVLGHTLFNMIRENAL